MYTIIPRKRRLFMHVSKEWFRNYKNYIEIKGILIRRVSKMYFVVFRRAYKKKNKYIVNANQVCTSFRRVPNWDNFMI